MKKVDNIVELTEEEKAQVGRRFGKRLNDLCRRDGTSSGLSLLFEAGLERQYFKLRKGGNPTLQTICLCAKVLGVHPRELLDFDNEQKIFVKQDFKDLAQYREFKKNLEEGEDNALAWWP
jgi:hypothetical protein